MLIDGPPRARALLAQEERGESRLADQPAVAAGLRPAAGERAAASHPPSDPVEPAGIFYFLEEMPLKPTGKVDRAGLKKIAEDHLQPHGLS